MTTSPLVELYEIVQGFEGPEKTLWERFLDRLEKDSNPQSLLELARFHRSRNAMVKFLKAKAREWRPRMEASEEHWLDLASAQFEINCLNLEKADLLCELDDRQAEIVRLREMLEKAESRIRQLRRQLDSRRPI